MNRTLALVAAVITLAVIGVATYDRRTQFNLPSARETAMLQHEAKSVAPDTARIAVAPTPGDAHPIHSVLNIRSAMRYGDYRWDEGGVPSGPMWIRIDLKRQLISVFRDGHEIGTSVILYGGDNKPTPLGTFPVLARFKDHRSGPYDAPMPYTLRLTGDGVSIHGSDVRYGAATHGCVGVPLDFAARLFDQVRVGDPVTIVNA